MSSPKRIAKLISENIDEHHDDPAMDPKHFAVAVNAIIAAAPHGKQDQVIKKLIEVAQRDKGQLIDMLEKVEMQMGNTELRYVQDFYRSKASNITLIARLAQLAYDNEDAVMAVLDSIDLNTNYQEDISDDEDMYNSEGDGYSH